MLSRTALTMRRSDIVVCVAGKSFHYRMRMLLGCSSSRISRVNSLMPKVHSRLSAAKVPAQERVERVRSQAADPVQLSVLRVHHQHRNRSGFMGPRR